MGSISNITEDGFAPCAFHSFPSTLKNDGISGDYGSGFLGYALNTATFLTHHDEFGWLSFGGNCTESGEWIKTDLTTAAKNRVLIAPVGLWLTLDAGQFKSICFNTKTGDVKIEFESATPFASEAFLHVNTTGKEITAKEYETASLDKNDRGAFTIHLKNEPVTIILKQKK